MKMTSRKSVLLAATAALLFAVPASSYEFNGFRVEAQGGWDQFKVDYGYWGLQNAGFPHAKSGWVYGAEAGYDYRINDNWLIGVYGNYDRSTINKTVSANDGSTFQLDLRKDWSANARVGYKFTDSTMFYVGGGYAKVKANAFYQPASSLVSYDYSSNVKGYRVSAGIEQGFGSMVYGKLEYRYTNYYQGDIRNSVLAGIGIRFGQYSPPPPPPPPPAPPPPAPMAAPLPPCPPAAVTPGPFLVFFDWDKSNVSPEASAILDRAVQQYQTTGQTSVSLVGNTDTSGSPDYNMALSLRRADAVKAYMVGKGIPDGAATATGVGETALLVQTADGVREPQNRRVEITFGGGAQPMSSGPCTPQ